MEILKCNATPNNVYYVEYKGQLCQCKFIRTESSGGTPVYVLNIAQRGIVKIPANRNLHFDKWYRNSKLPSILYERVEDYRTNKPIIDDYGSTSNCYNSSFITPLFKRCSVCNCGGSIHTWKWNGHKAVKHFLSATNLFWCWDNDGFHCALNELEDCYPSKEDCERNNTISVVTF